MASPRDGDRGRGRRRPRAPIPGDGTRQNLRDAPPRGGPERPPQDRAAAARAAHDRFGESAEFGDGGLFDEPVSSRRRSAAERDLVPAADVADITDDPFVLPREEARAQPVADAPLDNWVDQSAPLTSRPYLRLMRVDRPIGAWLLMLPGWQGLVLAGGWADWNARSGDLATFGWFAVGWLFLAFAIGAVVMRGAGCVLNDLIDRDIDRQVARTRSRPLASGQVTVAEAIALLLLLCLTGLLILMSFNTYAIMLGLASAVPVAIYPFMKRITWWPQIFLGIAFNWGALLGWAAMTGGLHPAAVALYASGVFWTIGYDTIYAHQDREDDEIIGVKSTARLFGRATRPALAFFYTLSVFCAGLAGLLALLGPWFWLGLAGFAAHLLSQIWRLDIDDPDLCLHLFRTNRDAGLILFSALILGSL